VSDTLTRSSPALFHGAVTTLAPLEEVVGAVPRPRLVPLWRHAAWLVALFGVCAFAVHVRLDVQELRKDLDRQGRRETEARVLNERLHLEMDARRRAVAMEQIAGRMGLTAQAQVVHVRNAE
jgi:hypothetical protein